MPRWTQEQAQDNLKSKGFELLSTYSGCKDKVEIRCPECGGQFEARYDHLMNGHTRSCGCMTKPSLVGRRFKRWKVIGETRNKHGQLMWECQCDCGTIRPVMAHSLTSGMSTSCGCYALERISGPNGVQWKGHGEISGSIWVAMKCSAENRGLEFAIDIQYGWDLFLTQNRKCVYTGLDLFFGTSRKRNASLDRIDSNGHYVEGNVQWVHKTINIMKRDMSEKEFLEWCHLVTKYTKTKKRSS